MTKPTGPILLTEALEGTWKVITEAISDPAGKPEYFIEGVFLQSNVKNGNGRIYPRSVLKEAVDIYREQFILTNRALGELGHPETPGIHWPEVCLKVVEIREEGDNFIGRAKILGTPAGCLVKSLIDDGIQLAVSSRGRGEVKNNVVQNGFRLVAAVDIVHDPSAPDAFVTSLIEGKEWVLESGILVEKSLEELQNRVSSANRSLMSDAKMAGLELFFKKLANKN